MITEYYIMITITPHLPPSLHPPSDWQWPWPAAVSGLARPLSCSQCTAAAAAPPLVTCSCTTLTCLTLYCSTAGLIQVNSLQPLSTRLCTQSYAPRHTPIKQNRYLLDPVQRRQSTAPSCTAGIWESSHQPSQVFIVSSALRPQRQACEELQHPSCSCKGCRGALQWCSCSVYRGALHAVVQLQWV